ncbi:MAG: SAM-dependent methyltransferase, partial [Candidatus Eremiobacteraeota bacterium]|nr:SAM-dependent methyltransferase [Candidatus Eremiobacteraeota bacterium]
MADERGRELLAQLAHFTEAQAAAATALARKSVEQTVAAAALATAFARRRARSAGKFTQADEMFFTRAGYEQSTSEAVARHRAERFARYRTVVDLCCGIGSDTIALAGAPGRSRDVIGVDNDTDALACAT